eukprot:scaffold112357_cov35-Prasinocladus_malaysianus.AAC.1
MFAENDHKACRKTSSELGFEVDTYVSNVQWTFFVPSCAGLSVSSPGGHRGGGHWYTDIQAGLQIHQQRHDPHDAPHGCHGGGCPHAGPGPGGHLVDARGVLLLAGRPERAEDVPTRIRGPQAATARNIAGGGSK